MCEWRHNRNMFIIVVATATWHKLCSSAIYKVLRELLLPLLSTSLSSHSSTDFA